MNAAARVGVVGVGAMGLQVVGGLVAAGFAVSCYDRDETRADVAAAMGATWASSVQACVADADVLVTVLPSATETRTVLLGGALKGLARGVCWLDLGSGDPQVTDALSVLAADFGIGAVAAPMGGSVGEAERRALHFFVGGVDSDVQTVLPLLAALGAPKGVQRVGERPSDAQVVKLLANALWFAHAAAATEALLLGQAVGIDPDELRRMLGDSAGGSVFMDRHMTRLLDGDYLETFPIDRVVEELHTVRSLAELTQTPTPVLGASANLHEQALERFGPAMGELLGARLLEERAGTTLRRESGLRPAESEQQ